ncbi:MAG: hypothetical protein ACTSRT_20985 [Promethearchaeota archaeon]
MAFRLWRKAILMTLREKKIFTVFILIYTSLIFLTSMFMELAFTGGIGNIAGFFVLIFLGVSLLLSLLYAWIIFILVICLDNCFEESKNLGYTKMYRVYKQRY